MKLATLPTGQSATITNVDWTQLSELEAKRLRALGIDTGSTISVAHRGVFGGGDPLAVTLGRTTIALRRTHAAAIDVTAD